MVLAQALGTRHHPRALDSCPPVSSRPSSLKPSRAVGFAGPWERPNLLSQGGIGGRAVRAMAHASDVALGAPLDFSVAVFSSRPYVREFLETPLKSAFSRVTFLEVGCARALLLCKRRLVPACHARLRKPATVHLQARLNKDAAVLAEGYDAVCLFVNDDASEKVRRVGTGGTPP